MQSCLDIEVTRRCNLRCDYCFVGWSRDWTSDLPVEVARAVVVEGAAHFRTLHFTGGEPFAYKPLYELVELGLSCGYEHVLINSNGTLQTPADIVRLATYGGRVGLSISLDGPEPVHDAIRGEGRYARAARTVDALLAAGVPVTVMAVVTAAWLHDLPDFLRGQRDAHPGLAGITLFPVGVGPNGSQKPGASLAPLTPAELQQLAVYVALAFHAGMEVGVAAYPMINPLLARLGYPAERLYQCAAGRGRMCVHADRSVSSCHPVKDAIYGTWRPGLFDRVATFEGHGRLAARDFDGCRACSHREACGHCRAFVTAAGAPLYGNDGVCLDAVPGRRAERAHTEAEALLRHFGRVLLDGTAEELATVVTDDVVDENPAPLQPPGRDGVWFKLCLHRATFPEATSALEAVTVESDGVATARWRTRLHAGGPVGTWEGRFSIRDGRVAAFSASHVHARD